MRPAHILRVQAQNSKSSAIVGRLAQDLVESGRTGRRTVEDLVASGGLLRALLR